MKINAIKESKQEAERFLKRVDEYEKEYEEDKTRKWRKASFKESGALRRASLDLTRSLAKMRNPE